MDIPPAFIAFASLVGCGGSTEPTVVTVHAAGAALVAIDVGDGWRVEPAGDITFDQPDGVYRVARNCRSDAAATYFLLAAPGDPTELRLDCPTSSGGVEVTFDVTGEVAGLFIDRATRYGSGGPVLVRPGTYDVVATQFVPGTFEVARAQVIRDVVVDGPTRIPIDVTSRGAPLEDVTVRPAGESSVSQVTGLTARGTWFQLGARGTRQLPAGARVAGDRHDLNAQRSLPVTAGAPPMRAAATIPIVDGEVEITLPTSDARVTVVTEPRPAASWSSVEGWERVSFGLFQDNTYTVPGWTVSATARALELGAELALPELPPGWPSSWSVDLAGYHGWSATLARARADGGSESITATGGRRAPPQP